MKLQATRDGVLIAIRVKPKSKQFRITVESSELAVFCREAPEKGRVNRELLKEFSRLFKGKVEIVSGFSSRQKRILIRDIDATEVERILDEHFRVDADGTVNDL